MILSLIIILIVVLAVGYWLFMSSYSQLFGPYLWHVKAKEKVIALTFDDGPNEPYTSEILNILNHYKIKATFFMVGNCIKRYPETAKKVVSDGHSIGNHSVSHQFSNYFKANFFQKEVLRNQRIFKDYLDLSPTLYRSPWLWRYPSLLRKLRIQGLTPISGEFCHSFEIFQIDAKRIATAVIKKAKPGAIIIFHDGKEGKTGDRSQTVLAVKSVVEQLISDGFRFVTVDELIKINSTRI